MSWLLLSVSLAQEAVTLLAEHPLGADHPFVSELPLFGDARLRVDALQDAPLDDLDTLSERSAWGTSRLRLGLARTEGTGNAALELEGLSSRWGGGTTVGTTYGAEVFAVDRTGSGADLITVIPRQAWVGLQGAPGAARVGAQTFTWGTGMLANDGAGDPVFGDAVRGSVVNRVLGVWTPWRADPDRGALRGVAFLGAADVVLRDDNADLYRGDLAAQGVFGVRSDAPRWRAGLLGVARFQRDRADGLHPLEHPTTLAFPVDAHARVQLLDPDADHTLGVEGEVVGVTGRTTRPWTDETWQDGARLRTGAFVARVRYDHNPARLTALLEGGGASGDNDLRDDVVRTYAMHSDHNVGLILFEELLPMLTARSLDRVADPGLAGVPPASGRFVVSQGQVQNAIYVYPTVRWRLHERVEARLGWMGAWTAGDAIDVYQTALNGGYNTTWGGDSPGGHALGHEALAGTRVALPVGDTRLDLGAEVALFTPGSALDGLSFSTLGTARGKVDFRW